MEGAEVTKGDTLILTAAVLTWIWLVRSGRQATLQGLVGKRGEAVGSAVTGSAEGPSMFEVRGRVNSGAFSIPTGPRVTTPDNLTTFQKARRDFYEQLRLRTIEQFKRAGEKIPYDIRPF